MFHLDINKLMTPARMQENEQTLADVKLNIYLSMNNPCANVCRHNNVADKI